MSLAAYAPYTPRSIRSNWTPVQPAKPVKPAKPKRTASHRADVPITQSIPIVPIVAAISTKTGPIAMTTTAAVVGLALLATEMPAVLNALPTSETGPATAEIQVIDQAKAVTLKSGLVRQEIPVASVTRTAPAHKADVAATERTVTKATRPARHAAPARSVSLSVIAREFPVGADNPLSLNEQRARDATIIIEQGIKYGLSRHSIAIAIATSIQEANLVNVHYGDRDSGGAFQQRPSCGWGTWQQVTDVVYAADQFYDRLDRIKDRDSRPMIDVAMQIQIPNRQDYESRWAWDGIATAIVNDYFA